MSRVGLKKIKIPSGVEVKLDANILHVKGPKGKGSQQVRPELAVVIKGDEVFVSRSSNLPFVRSLHGLIRSEINNVIIGVKDGFEKVLELQGVGYRAALEGKVLVLTLGFSHPIRFELPPGIEATVEKQTVVTIKGINKYLVGEVSAKIRALRPPEPYKGKGVKYKDEHIIRKEGKKGK